MGKVDRLIAGGVVLAQRLPDSTRRKIRVADVLALPTGEQRRNRVISEMVADMVESGTEY